MRLPKLSKLEMQIMEVLWTSGPSAIREIQESFGGKNRPAYTTVQTMVYRLEAKKALRRAKKIGNAHIFESVISRGSSIRFFNVPIRTSGSCTSGSTAASIAAGSINGSSP